MDACRYFFNAKPETQMEFDLGLAVRDRNSSPYPNQYSGVESLVYNRYGAAARMAYNINAGLEQVGFVNLGVNERPNLVVLNSTNMPAVLGWQISYLF